MDRARGQLRPAKMSDHFENGDTGESLNIQISQSKYLNTKNVAGTPVYSNSSRILSQFFDEIFDLGALVGWVPEWPRITLSFLDDTSNDIEPAASTISLIACSVRRELTVRLCRNRVVFVLDELLGKADPDTLFGLADAPARKQVQGPRGTSRTRRVPLPQPAQKPRLCLMRILELAVEKIN